MSREEVLKTALDWFHGDDLKANVWVDKYCLRDGVDYLESTPDEMFVRLATEFARVEHRYVNPLSYDDIYWLLKDFRYVIPGGSILYGVGNDHSYSTLGNCFVIGDTTDSYGSIMKIDEEQAQLMKRRGGVGHDLSHLRPKGDRVTNAAGSSTGPVSFMGRYSNTTREVGQDGRRGALMLTMNVDHPDILDFITAKDDLTKNTGCNISVKVTDNFMNSLFGDQPEAIGTYEYKSKIWKQLIHQAWKSAEPGVLFWDTIVNNSPADKYKEFESISTNPCGEIPLCAYDTCRLMSVNLFSFVENPFTDKAYFNESLFIEVVSDAQRLMDDVIDLEDEKIHRIFKKLEDEGGSDTVEYDLWLKIQAKLLHGRRTGLSCIGLADCLAALGIQYGSDESLKFCDAKFKIFHDAAYRSSEVMAAERGAFPAWRHSIDPVRRRNIALLTIPPCGSISILAGVSSGIEPVFNLSYTRRRKVDKSDNVVFVDKNGDKWEEYKVYHPGYMKWFDIDPFASLEGMSPYHGSTANEINPLTRVQLQATIQKHIDHSISSTINLPKETTEQEIADIYMLAWKTGCKGITIYREGCRDGVLINKTEQATEFKQHSAPKRPKTIDCYLRKIRIKGVDHWVIVGLYDGKPYEVFTTTSDLNWNFIRPVSGIYQITKISSGNYVLLDGEDVIGNVTENLTDEQKAITRLVSTALRHGTDIKFIVEQLNKTQGDLTSFNQAIARVLKRYIPDGVSLKGETCDVCGNGMTMENGCLICKSCGNSRCS